MRILLFVLFFISGASGLILETVWFRQLALIFGSTSAATATVASAFFGGLGIGGWLAALLADRIKRRPLVYGLLELIVGGYALISPLVLNLLTDLQAGWMQGTSGSAAFSVVRVLVIFVALLPATVAMGMTLPLLARAAIGDERRIGSSLGSLYGINTLGAFVGVLVGGFVLLPTVGQSMSLAIAGGISLFVGAMAVAASFLLGETPGAAISTDSELARRKPVRPYFLLGAFVFVSGLGAMLLQVGMQRVLAVVIGSSVYSFTLIVAVYLGGIGIGSLIYGLYLHRRIEPFKLLAYTQLAVALGIVAAVMGVEHLPRLLLDYARSGAVGVPGVFFVHAGLIALVLIVPTVAMGISLPTAMRLLTANVGRVGRDVGWAWGLNTFGGIVGAFLAAFVLIPEMGLQSTVLYAAGLSVVFAALFYSSVGSLLNKRRAMILAPIALLISIMLPNWPQWDVGRLTAGMYRVGLASRVPAGEDVPRGSMLYYRDGTVGTVSVEKRGEITTMRINGKVEASNNFDMPTQVLVGILPYLLHKDASGQRAGLIGWGSGVTAGAMLAAPIASLTAVELEPRVIDASSWFGDVNFQPRNDARLDLRIGDARTVLGFAPRPFDIIVSEPSNPWVAGSGSLFTVDFYRRMKARLKPGGVYAQWIQLYELSPEHLRMLVRTFNEVFPSVLIFTTSNRGVDLVLVGRDEPWQLPVKTVVERANLPQVKRVLNSAGIGGGLDVLALASVTPEEVDLFTGPGRVNTDDNGRIEFSAPKDMLFYQRYRQDALDFHYRKERGHILPLLTDLGKDDGQKADSLANLALHLLVQGHPDSAYELAAQALKVFPRYKLALEVQHIGELIYVEPDGWPPVVNAWLLEAADDKLAELAILMVQPDPAPALKLAVELNQRNDDKRLDLLLGVLALKALQFDLAWEVLEPLSEDEAFRTQHPVVDFFAGRAADRQMRFGSSVRLLARYNVWRQQVDWPIRYEMPEGGETHTIELEVEGEDGEAAESPAMDSQPPESSSE